MRTLDFAPLLRSSIGFENLNRLVDFTRGGTNPKIRKDAWGPVFRHWNHYGAVCACPNGDRTVTLRTLVTFTLLLTRVVCWTRVRGGSGAVPE